MQTKVGKWGNSLAIRIPRHVARMSDLKDGTIVTIQIGKEGIVLKRASPRYSLEELVGKISSDNRHEEKTWGGPTGSETW